MGLKDDSFVSVYEMRKRNQFKIKMRIFQLVLNIYKAPFALQTKSSRRRWKAVHPYFLCL